MCPSGRTNGVGLGHSGIWRLCLGLLVGEGAAEGGVWCETGGAGKRLVPAVRLEEGAGQGGDSFPVHLYCFEPSEKLQICVMLI